MQAIDTATIERAFKAIEANEVKLVNNGKVSSEVMGYISSFGAAVIQAGLIPAVIFFSEASNDGDAKDRPKLILALYHMIQAEDKLSEPASVLESPPIPEPGSLPKILLDYLRANPSRLDSIEDRLLENAIALKIALRSFEKSKS